MHLCCVATEVEREVKREVKREVERAPRVASGTNTYCRARANLECATVLSECVQLQ